MNEEQLAALISVVETGSFSASAKKLGTAQSTVSRRVMQMENELGLRLFDRSSEAVQLSKDGEAIFPRTVRLAGIYRRIAELSPRAKAGEGIRISTDQMRSVLAVAETLSFSAAAEKLNFSQAAVSKHVRVFEEQTGAQVFLRRNGFKVGVNAAARGLIAEVEAAIDCYRRMRRNAAELSARNGQSIVIGTSHHICNDVENGIIADFCADNPAIRTTQIYTTVGALAEMLLSGGVDALLLKYSDKLDSSKAFQKINGDRDIAVVRLVPEKLHVAIASFNPLASREKLGIEELKNEKFAFTSYTSRPLGTFAAFMAACTEAGAFPAIYDKDKIEVGALMRLVAKGEVVALSLNSPVVKYQGVSFIPIDKPWINSCVTLFARKSGRSQALEAFAEHALRYAQDCAAGSEENNLGGEADGR